VSGIANRPLAGLPRSRYLISGRDKGCFFIPKRLVRPAQLPIHSVTGALSPLLNLLWRETDHSSVQDKNERICTSPSPLPPYAFMACTGTTVFYVTY